MTDRLMMVIDVDRPLAEIVNDVIAFVVQQSKSQEAAAKSLKINRRTVYRRLLELKNEDSHP